MLLLLRNGPRCNVAIIVFDDFSGESDELLTDYDPAWWEVTTTAAGNWARISNAGRVRGGTTVACWAHSGTAGVQRVSCDLYRVSDTQYTAAGLMFTYAGAVYGAAYTVRVRWRPLAEQSAVSLFKPTTSSVVSNPLASVQYQLPLETVVRLRLEQDGADIRVYIDDELFIDYTDSDPRVLSGGGILLHGYQSNNDSVGIHVDNFLAEDGGDDPVRRLSPLFLTPW